MILEVLDQHGRPQQLRARRVLVLADDGVTPLAVALEYMPGSVFASHAGESNFQQVLAALGTNRTVHVERFKPKPFDEIASL